MARCRLHHLLAVCALGAAVGGCAHTKDPRFEQRTAERKANIQRVVDRFAAREAEGPERLAHIARLTEEAAERHQTNLERTLEVVRQKDRRDRERWPKSWARARAKIAEELAGDPENIDATIPRMFY